MSYSEQDGQVTLNMSREDYDELLIVFAAATKLSLTGPMGNLIYGTDQIVALLNRLNEGNPNYTPYLSESKCQVCGFPKSDLIHDLKVQGPSPQHDFSPSLNCIPSAPPRSTPDHPS